jgi:hypothetical protein
MISAPREARDEDDEVDFGERATPASPARRWFRFRTAARWTTPAPQANTRTPPVAPREAVLAQLRRKPAFKRALDSRPTIKSKEGIQQMVNRGQL